VYSSVFRAAKTTVLVLKPGDSLISNYQKMNLSTIEGGLKYGECVMKNGVWRGEARNPAEPAQERLRLGLAVLADQTGDLARSEAYQGDVLRGKLTLNGEYNGSKGSAISEGEKHDLRHGPDSAMWYSPQCTGVISAKCCFAKGSW
jgi:hypothetical protein